MIALLLIVQLYQNFAHKGNTKEPFFQMIRPVLLLRKQNKKNPGIKRSGVFFKYLKNYFTTNFDEAC
jgi:hypothetical protein